MRRQKVRKSDPGPVSLQRWQKGGGPRNPRPEMQMGVPEGSLGQTVLGTQQERTSVCLSPHPVSLPANPANARLGSSTVSRHGELRDSFMSKNLELMTILLPQLSNFQNYRFEPLDSPAVPGVLNMGLSQGQSDHILTVNYSVLFIYTHGEWGGHKEPHLCFCRRGHTEAPFPTDLAVTPSLAEHGAQACSAGPSSTPFLPAVQTDLPALVMGGPQRVSCLTWAFQHSVRSSGLCLRLLARQPSALGLGTSCDVAPVSCRAPSIPGAPVAAPPLTIRVETLKVSNEKRPVSPALSYCPAGETEAQTDTLHFLRL